ncbi:CvfB family protein [Paenibacillus sp. y28]|uniref:CvfB family protein n=1 Tax=Paenibacillus sp. y28 TaxID=3129110 RepID=UPI003018530B
MTLEAGTRARLQVAREVAPNGFFLTDGERDVLMHYSEMTGSVKVGDTVEVFLFHDTDDRFAATMKTPLLQYGELGLLEVADIHPRLGCFLEMGLGRQLLLPLSDLPEKIELRPELGDKVYVVMTRDKQGRLLARLASEAELIERSFPAPSSWKNEWKTARVYKPLQMGSFVVIDGGVIGFGAIGLIHEKERTRLLRLGEQVEVRVSFIREDGRVNVSMRQLQYVSRDADADKLLAFLKDRPNRAMPYSDETQADLIQQRFGMSKSAFKRALGKLMKEGLIEQKGSWTHLKDEEGGTTESFARTE